MTKTLTPIAMLALLTLGACGDVGYQPPVYDPNPTGPSGPTTPWVNQTPSIHVASGSPCTIPLAMMNVRNGLSISKASRALSK